MKKVLLLLLVMAMGFATQLIAQAPLRINYQGVARNNFGTTINNKTISLRLSVREGSAGGGIVYSETHTINTDQYGVFALRIGGGSVVSGTMAGVNWAVNDKFLQVEMDQNGGSAYANMGTSQLISVPYSIIAGGAPPIGPAGGDLAGSTYPNPTIAPSAVTTGKIADGAVTTPKLADASVTTAKIADGAVTSQKITVPFIKSQADAASLISMTNTSATNGSTGISGTTNGNGPSSFGVVGTANNGGFGVAGYSNAISVLGVAAATTGQAGRFETFNAANGTPTLGAWNGAGSGPAIDAINLGTGTAGTFTVSNPASTADALRAVTNGIGASWAIRATSTGTNGAGLFISNNATATNNNLQSNTNGLGRAGLFNSTNAASTSNGVDINVAGTGFALRAASSNAAPKALLTAGGVQLTGIGEAANRVLVSDAAGNATWQTATGIGIVTGSGTTNFIPKLTPTGTNIGNSLLFDNGSSVGLGTITPTHRLDVTHGGSTGIGVNSTAGFSVVDINAASGDAALRFGNAGVNQWNMRNRPGDNYLEFFELGGGGSRMAIQDGTGNVGIGNTSASIAYKLDVEHGGSTGIRSKSTSSFSVVDIDAASGDAALRFAKAGVNQWNTRNRPSDDYYEIFELGGGGSRMVIQDATGNVGIGETTNPSYKLDVLHGGSTGIRSRSSASFSVVDIDAQSGDAALRFQKAGVNQWNIRNRPADDYLEIFELGGGGSRMVIQDATGNVGIGETTAPAYKLDVLHGGSTGIRSRSSASFSVVDIDAQSGDAALRFQKAGVNQWNVRNRPADDYFEIFELGGGGSRVVIQDATGNVGIGETTAPAYKLDVLHGGSTGIRSRSSASFSVVDIDGQSGDAALRFQKAGVNQWNTRNNPATDDYQIFELGGGGERMRIDNTTGKVWVNGDFTVVGVKAFTMDHPLDPTNKTLMHVAAESNEVINFYSGNVTTDANGKAIVTLPDYYEALNKDSRYQLTVIGSFAQAIINKEVANNKFEIATNQPNVKVSWEVKGVRNDAHMRKFPFQAVQEKGATQKGKYVDPAAYDKPESMRVSYSDTNGGSSLDDVTPQEVAKKAIPSSGGSLDQAPIVAPAKTAAAETNSSISNQAPVTNKKVEIKADLSGSVSNEVKKEDKKPVAKPTEKGSVD
jgi:hypothetical protein